MKTVFTGFTVYMGAFSSPSAGSMWWQLPATIRAGFGTTPMVPIDLALSPSRVAQPQQAVIEDFRDGPHVRGTTLGGSIAAGWNGWPEGATSGQAYLSDDYRNANGLPAVPPDGGGAPYEFQTTWYWPGTGAPQAGIRYLGFHAQILQQVTRLENGVNVTRALIAVYRAGTSQASTPTVERVLNWVNLADVTQFDQNVANGGLTAIGTDAGQPTTGALFISDSYANIVPFDDPKKPKNLGE